jgi:hypothetical protein
MKFERISGFEGKIFIPEDDSKCKKKHSCKDCMSCQFCSDTRCELCLKRLPKDQDALEIHNKDS